MTVSLYSGTPRSGKSCHAVRDIMLKLMQGKSVICNFPGNMAIMKKHEKSLVYKIFGGKRKLGNYYYVPYNELTVDKLMRFARENHIHGKEHQTLIVIDEAQVMFNTRDYLNPNRSDWVMFFSQHGKLGYDVILATIGLSMIDKQIRLCIENNFVHRCLNNYRLAFLMPGQMFVAIKYWTGVREKVGYDFFQYTDDMGNFFDSYKILTLDKGALAQGVRPLGGVPMSEGKDNQIPVFEASR